MATQTAPVFAIQRSGERAYFDFGWLKTHHSFRAPLIKPSFSGMVTREIAREWTLFQNRLSFADYHDPANTNWGALRVFNDDTVLPGQGFGTHPHRDMEIVTYVLRGEVEHKDSLGHHGVVAPGGIQYISAGTGVRHSEFNHSTERDVHFVQMWVLPRSSGEAPAYGQHAFGEDERRNRWLVLMSGQTGVEAPVALRADASLRVAKLDDTAVTYAFDPARYGFLFVADGSVTANGERLATGDALRIHGHVDLEVCGTGELVLWDVPPAMHETVRA